MTEVMEVVCEKGVLTFFTEEEASSPQVAALIEAVRAAAPNLET